VRAPSTNPIGILGSVLREVMLAWALIAAIPAVAAAQGAEAEPAPIDAREAFRRGSEAAAEERWADSERWFRRAYEASGVSSALFNQAVALRALGRHVEARDAFAELLRGEVDPTVEQTARGLMEQSAARVATIELAGLEAGEEHGIQLDGVSQVDDGSRPLVLEADEGSHSVLVVRPGYEPYTWSGELAPGATEVVSVELEAVPEQTVVIRETVREGTSVFEEPAFWIIVGVVLAGTAAAIGIGVGFDQAQLDPMTEVVFEL